MSARRSLSLPVVRREFRGAVLFCTGFDMRDGGAMSWSADPAAAHVFPSTADAYAAAAFAATFWRADCVAVDGDGALLQPAAVREYAAEPRGKATAREFPRAARIAERVRHCPEHSGYSDGCAECYDMAHGLGRH